MNEETKKPLEKATRNNDVKNNKRRPKRNFDKPKSDLEDKVISINRVTKVVKGDVKEKYTYWNDGEQYDGEREADLTTKIKAIDTLNKMDNSYQQNVKINGTISNPYANLSEEDLRKLAGE